MTTQLFIHAGVWSKPNDAGFKRAAPIDVEKEPVRVWTLPEQTLHLPFKPRHGDNAFLEDKIHDWKWKNGKLHYHSRLANGPVWLLLEY